MERCIAIDFDGTIAQYSGWTGINKFGKLIDGCVEAIGKLKEMGFKIIIYTCRINTPEFEKYLKKNKVPYDAINENIWHEYQQHGDKRKVIADIYIDDRAINFNGNWKDIPDKIFNFHNATDRLNDKEKLLMKLRSNNPYPKKIFPTKSPEEWKKLHEIYKNNGIVMDGYNGNISRWVWELCCNKLEKLIKEK